MRPFPIPDVTGVYDIRLLNFKTILLTYSNPTTRSDSIGLKAANHLPVPDSTIEVGLIQSTPLNTALHIVLYFVTTSYKLKPTKYTIFREKYLVI
jgi:hypothetical protein